MSLIEVLVVAAILAVLTLVAVPGYRTYVVRSHRVEAMSALLALAAAQETHFLRHNTYTAQLTAAPPDGLGMQPVTASGFYTLAIVSADAETFGATATATGAQASDTQCPAFSIDQSGTKSATRPGCWSR
jgi:type IV pilus assembly protein PilE